MIGSLKLSIKGIIYRTDFVLYGFLIRFLYSERLVGLVVGGDEVLAALAAFAVLITEMAPLVALQVCLVDVLVIRQTRLLEELGRKDLELVHLVCVGRHDVCCQAIAMRRGLAAFDGGSANG